MKEEQYNYTLGLVLTGGLPYGGATLKQENIHSYLKILSEPVNPLSKHMIISNWYRFVTLVSNNKIKMIV